MPQKQDVAFVRNPSMTSMPRGDRWNEFLEEQRAVMAQYSEDGFHLVAVVPFTHAGGLHGVMLYFNQL